MADRQTVALADRGGLHRALRVARVVPEGNAGVTLVLDGDFAGEAGQFVMAWLPGVEERPFSLVSTSPAMLTVARVGTLTCALCALQPGDRLWLRGPYGRGFALRGERHLLVTGGSGSAGIALLAQRARAQGHAVRVALGARTREGLMLGWHLRDLGCELLPATDDGSHGLHGTALDAAEPSLAAIWTTGVYVCGPEALLSAVASRCGERGLPCQVSIERVMRCGLGLCGSCHCGELLACADGPVLDAGRYLRAVQPPN